MRHKNLLFTLLATWIFAAGCSTDETASQKVDKAKTETKDAAQNMKDYTYAQKSEFVQKMQNQLNALNQDLEKLNAKIRSSSDTVKAEAQPKLQALRDQAGQLSVQLDNVKNATASTWDSVKDGSRKAYNSLADAFQQARQWLSDKIAP